MASGTKQHLGLTVLSTNKEVDGLTAKFDNVTRKGGKLGDAVAKVNGAIGNRALFNSYEEANNLPLEKTEGWGLVKAIDAYGDVFYSIPNGTMDKGAALMADAGLDVIKYESKNVHLGLGPRADTGINVGRQGVRTCFLGSGAELILGCKDGEEAPKAEEKPWYKDLKVRGIGVQFIWFKLKVLWA